MEKSSSMTFRKFFVLGAAVVQHLAHISSERIREIVPKSRPVARNGNAHEHVLLLRQQRVDHRSCDGISGGVDTANSADVSNDGARLGKDDTLPDIQRGNLTVR